jgi:hypothetical protein
MSKIPYGYQMNNDGMITIHETESSVVKNIFQLYLSGNSLGKIASCLAEEKITSPTGNDIWNRQLINYFPTENT